ncbi:hypothetical protein MVEN_01034900 [Mycena venus]|uniref:F-box domain-containing protein n=1 Tax=Mycena venus TaxID=2733690 RepID=A0A8H6Y9Q5_9AGAR|nr:hypothetical protein MVEN_01034900 [Mycena venus]
MALSPPNAQSRLVRLPTELLLTIVHLLDERSTVSFLESGEKPPSASSYPSHLHSLSLVCRHLRQLCLSPLFSRLKIAHTCQLRRLKDKCAIESEFARLIRQLNLAHVDSSEERDSRRTNSAGKTSGKKDLYRYGPDILPALLPCLKSLEWLEFDAKQIDPNLLATLNAHPKLTTVAICDQDLGALRALSSSTCLSLSKIRVHSALSNFSFGFQRPAFHSLMNRGPRLAHLIVRGENNTRAGPGTLVVPGLETLDIGVSIKPTFPMSWLPAFVERHANLHVIKFSGHPSIWRHNPDITFPLQFVDALERESLARTVDLVAFSISRTGVTCPLDDWQVVHLEIVITKEVGIFTLTIANSMAPQISSLIVRMSRKAMEPIHIDNLISSLCLFSSLRRLELHGVFRRLLYEGVAPWALSSDDPVGQASRCIVAHAALRWLAACVAQRALSLDLVHITDEGYDVLDRRSHHSWELDVTYQVQQNRHIVFHGTPRFVMAKRFSPSDKQLAQLSMTKENSRFYSIAI